MKATQSAHGPDILSRGTNGFQILTALARMEEMAPVHHIGPKIEADAGAGMLKHGPAVVVQIKNPASGRASIPLLAVIDTGASISAIDTVLAAALFDEGEGKVTSAMLATGTLETRELCAEFTVPQIDTVQTLTMITMPLAQQGIQVLLGRDFLADKVMIYDGKTGRVTLCR